MKEVEDMDDPKALQFFQEILGKTKQGRIRWEPTAAEQTFIAAIAGKFTVAVTAEVGQDGWGNETIDHDVVLKDQEGRVLVRADTSIGATVDDLRSLYDLARRQALKVDEHLDTLLGELKKL